MYLVQELKKFRVLIIKLNKISGANRKKENVYESDDTKSISWYEKRGK